MDEQKNDSADKRRFLAGQKQASGQSLVITGMSGRFPNCSSTQDYLEKLINKYNLCDDDTRRWFHNHPDIPKISGKIYDIENFDAGFFEIHKRQSEVLNVISKLLLEVSFEAIMDAGVNPIDLAGSKTGVYLGVSYSETEEQYLVGSTYSKTNGLINCIRSSIAQRISYFLKLNGPSYTCDTACSSSMYAFEKAYADIIAGKCDGAIVGGGNLCLNKLTTLEFARLGILNMDTGCRPFDDNVAGYTRSEAIVVIFLQKEHQSKRIYGYVVHSKCNADGFKEVGINCPSTETQYALLQNIYEESGVDPNNLAFFEAHGTGTKVGDVVELAAIEKHFCKVRKEPLLIGSVKGNIGHTEGSSGLCAIVKVLLSMDTDCLIPNIHYDNPRKEISALTEGHLIVVTEKMKWPQNCEYAGINSFGFGGTNSHVILKRHLKEKIFNYDDLPRLVCFSGRTQKTVDYITEKLKTTKLDYDYVRLMQDIFKNEIPNHEYRGFSIIAPNGEINSSTKCCDIAKKPIYLCIGSNKGYSYKLLKMFTKIDIFKNTFDENRIKIDLLSESDNFVQLLITTVCLHLGLIDILKSLEIKFDIIMGTNMGNFTAAYANGSLTIEEVVLSVIAVSEIYLQTSRKDMASKLYKKLQQIIPAKTRHVNRMYIPKQNYCSYASAEYFVFNLINPDEKLSDAIEISDDAVIIDMDFDRKQFVQNIKILLLEQDCYLDNLMLGIGRLYQYGQQPQVHKLYPTIQWPVSCGTPMISPLIKWDHRNKITVHQLHKYRSPSNETNRKIDFLNSETLFYKGNVIDGQNIFPMAGYIFLIWEFYAHLNDVCANTMKICLENLQFHKSITIPTDGEVNFYLCINNGGDFEISNRESSLVTGRVYQIDEVQNFQTVLNKEFDHPVMNKNDIYKELRLRGYNYKGGFSAMQEYQGERCTVQWAENWVTFLENMLQLPILQKDTRSLYMYSGIDRIVIDSSKHLEEMQKLDEHKIVSVTMDQNNAILRTNHIEMRGLHSKPVPRNFQNRQPVLEVYKFIANNLTTTLDNSVRINIQTIIENMKQINLISVKVLEIYDSKYETLTPYIQQAFKDTASIQAELTLVTENELDLKDKFESKFTDLGYRIVIGYNLMAKELLKKTFLNKSFIISIENTPMENFIGYNCLTLHQVDTKYIYLMRKNIPMEAMTTIHISDNFNVNQWLTMVQNKIKTSKNLILYANNSNFNGILGLVNCARKEPGAEHVRCVFIQDKNVEFNSNDPFFKEQLNKNMAINVLNNRQWGTYRHVLLSEHKTIPSKHWLANNTNGNLSTLQWVEGKFVNMDNGNELIKIHYGTLNRRDVMLASGQISANAITNNRLEHECLLGIEFSGTDESGKQYMGLVNGGAISNYVKKKNCILMEIPDKWNLQQAATIPVAYGTVLTALELAKFKQNQSILINSSCGAICQAAINLCTYYKMTIFVSVDNINKKEWLLNHFNLLKNNHIGISRDASFEEMILKETKGKGVDIILNLLEAEKLQASLRCLAKRGSFLHIGKFDIGNNSKLSMDLINKEASFHGISLDGLFKFEEAKRINFKTLLLEGMAKGYIKPIIATTFEMEQIEKAFKCIVDGNDMGKVLIKMRSNDNTSVYPRFYCQPNFSYVIIGGLGGFGLELADWFVLRGCKNLILTSRTGIRSGYQKFRIDLWKKYGTNVIISLEDIATYEGCKKLIKNANKVAPIGGIFNLAVILRDAIMENQTAEDFTISFKPKAIATTHLDNLTRKFCPKIEYFVVFSSVTSGRGNAGQANYGMSNSIMERICEKRKSDGLPALAIQWGTIGDVGIVAEIQKGNKEIAIGGTAPQRIASCLEVMDRLLRQHEPVASSFVVAEKNEIVKNSDNPLDAVMALMGMHNLKSISTHSTLAELGMDSIMAVKIKEILKTNFGIVLTHQDMINLTFDTLSKYDK